MAELLIGCGNSRVKIIHPPGEAEWTDLTTLDLDPNAKPDVEWDLERLPLPFDSDRFDEIHAYHVLEHVGRQGDWKFFFAQFEDFWRILKPNGLFIGAVPLPGTRQFWMDPGHTRAISPDVFTFLDQVQYVEQVGVTAMTDYRHVYSADFNLEKVMEDPKDPDQAFFVLRAMKPSRVMTR